MKEYIFKLDNAIYDDKTGEAVFKPEIVGEIVRCKDCKHNDDGFCDEVMDGHSVTDDWFCKGGERRETE